MFNLTNEEIANNINKFKTHMIENGFDAFIFTSSDIYLNEYVPLEDNHRYYFSGFTGSTGPVWVTKNKVLLFVDSRYHEQADLEVDSKHVEVIKMKMGESFDTLCQEQIEKLNIKKLGMEGDRSSYGSVEKFKAWCEVKPLNFGEVGTVIDFAKRGVERPIYPVKSSVSGLTTAEKLDSVIESSDEAIFISALDSIAWLTNARGFHLPYQSTFLAKALALKNKIYVFVDEEMNLDNLLLDDSSVQYVFVKGGSLNDSVKNSTDGISLTKVYFDKFGSTYADVEMLQTIFGDKLADGPKVPLAKIHNVKNSSELAEMKISFNKSDTAIYNSGRWLAESFKNKEEITEEGFYNKANEFYKNEGAVDQSFKTIAAFGDNSSIIHFSDPSSERIGKEGEFVLLDSGAHYESGFATDTTRTFYLGDNPTDKHKEVYTMVLKGIINAERSIFPASTTGASIDAIARLSLASRGYEYGHGTGHGVGINVHEGSFRISPAGTDKLTENQVGSIEPGIYLPGFGGVRLENIVVVKKHPKFETLLCFEPLVYIGYEPKLINLDLLNQEEIDYLESYEAKCKERNRSFRC